MTHRQIFLHWRLNLSLPWKSHTSSRWGNCNKQNQVPPSKGNPTLLFLSLNCPETNKQKKSMKKWSKRYKIILWNGLYMQMHFFDFVSRPLWLKGKVWNEKEKYKLEREIFPDTFLCGKHTCIKPCVLLNRRYLWF